MSSPLPLIAFCAVLPLLPQDLSAQDSEASAPEPGARFADPVQLTFGGAPLPANIKYPSPRLFDLDRDGTAELVLGDLAGRVRVARRGDGVDPTAWGALEPLRTGDRPLVFHNW